MIKIPKYHNHKRVNKRLAIGSVIAFSCFILIYYLISMGEESEYANVRTIKVLPSASNDSFLSSAPIEEGDIQPKLELPGKQIGSLKVMKVENEIEPQCSTNPGRTYPILLDSVNLKLKTEAKSLLALDEELFARVSSVLDSLLNDIKKYEFEGTKIERIDSGNGVRVHVKGSESIRNSMIAKTYESLVKILGLEKANILRYELERALSNLAEPKILEFQAVMSEEMGESLEIKRFVGGEGAPSFTRTVSFRDTKLYADTISRYERLIEISEDD